MPYHVKIAESTSPYDLEEKINLILNDPELDHYDVIEVKTNVTPMPGPKVSRAGIFYLASILLKKN